MSEIHYNFSANNSSLDDVSSLVNSVQEVRSDISNLFGLLGTVYEGAGATALQNAHSNLNSMLDDVLQNMAITQKQAQDQQDAMKALDAQQAADF